MTGLSRRQFCAVLGAGLAGASAVLTACSGDDTAAPSSSSAPTPGPLDGLAFEVRRDPG